MQTKIAYTASGTTGILSVLTFNEIVGAIGVMTSLIFAGFTAWSNHKKNRKQMELIQIEIDAKRQIDEANG